jgi:para-nitrobenzyl esterase
MTRILRREFLKHTACGGIGLIAGAKGLSAFAKAPAPSPIITTSAGKVRGVTTSGVHTFKGIPYGASTSGRNRFMPPKAPLPWTEVRDVLNYGAWAMQPVSTTVEADEWRQSEEGQLYRGIVVLPTAVSEECLWLNVWTPGLDDGHKRPVMVWLHGGGFAGGGAQIECSDGTNLACRNDVVVVSLNHRLNIFGHLYLADLGGEKYANSGNVGMLDIVAALRWVHENIESFGGDPGNVTIFGHSGGGSKVNVLMAMPAAVGLFHKAIQMSGPGSKMVSREHATSAAQQLLSKLHIGTTELDRLQEVPAQELLRTMKAVLNDADLDDDETWRQGTCYHMFDPVVDGRSLPQNPFDPTAPASSSQVPLLLGTANEDSRIDAGLRAPLMFSLDKLDESSMSADLKGLGLKSTDAESLIRSYRSRRPGASPADLFSAIASDLEYRRDAILMAERKVALGTAPAYMYLFAWKSPAFRGKYGSAHAFCTPFVFDNVDMAPGLWGQTPDPRRYELASRVSKAWAKFARTGNPSHSSLPDWKPYAVHNRSTMVLNYSCELVADPRAEDRKEIFRIKM